MCFHLQLNDLSQLAALPRRLQPQRANQAGERFNVREECNQNWFYLFSSPRDSWIQYLNGGADDYV